MILTSFLSLNLERTNQNPVLGTYENGKVCKHCSLQLWRFEYEGKILGTSSYMAPDAVRSISDVVESVNIYFCFNCGLYEIETGKKKVFKGYIF